jgi:hypothetical protein
MQIEQPPHESRKVYFFRNFEMVEKILREKLYMKQKADIFYSNIGRKIKFLAKLLAIIAVIAISLASVIQLFVGLHMIVTADGWNADVQQASGFALIGLGFLYFIGGILVAWIYSWFMYGFGELIETNSEIVRLLRQNEPQQNSTGNQSTLLSERGGSTAWTCSICNRKHHNYSAVCPCKGKKPQDG